MEPIPIKYLLGVDGGGTGCRARLTDLQGHVLGEGSAGPANIALGVDLAKASVLQASLAAFGQAGLPADAMSATCAGLGMAAANVPRYREAMERVSLPFAKHAVRSDAEVACLGAHRGQDGGILILGTGSQGVLYQAGRFSTVGGWGFALSDSGSGALLGRAAVRRSFMAIEGIEPGSPMTEAIVGRFEGSRETMLDWSARARPADWAVFARIAFEFASQEDPVALQLVRESARAVERLLDRMVALGARRIALMGGVARPTHPYLPARLSALLVEPEGDAMSGALLLAREVLAPSPSPSPRD